MKVTRANFLIWIFVAPLLFISEVRAEMSDSRLSRDFTAVEQMERATVASENALRLIDEGHYSQAWEQSSNVFKKIISEADWIPLMRKVRLANGLVNSRSLIKRSYQREIKNAASGPYVILKYDMYFKLSRNDAHLETVIMRLDEDNSWRLAGYYLK